MSADRYETEEQSVRNLQRSLDAGNGGIDHADDCKHWEWGPCTCGSLVGVTEVHGG